jgi:hypothetical protein
MNPKLPPVIDPLNGTGSAAGKPANLGRLGLQIALVGPAVFLVFMALRPG